MKILPIACSLAFAVTASGATLDAIAARVNDDAITLDDVRNEIKRNPEISSRLQSAAKEGQKGVYAIYSAALDSLIERRLVLKQAADKKMEMQPWVVDNRIREIVHDRFDDDMSRLEANLAESRIPMTEFRDTIKEDMIIGAMRYQMVEKDLQPTPAQMQAEYEAHPERYTLDTRTSVRVIQLKPGDANQPSVSTRAAEIIDRLDKGEKFADLAIKYSSDSHAKDGGLWKDVNPEKEFSADIVSALFKLKPGERSEPIMLGGSCFILWKESESAAGKLSFADAYDRVMRNVKQEIGHRLHREWIARLRAEAFVKIYPMPTEN